MTTTLPAIAKRENQNRRIEIFFDLGPSSPSQAPGTQYAVISVGHSRDRKEFYAVLNQQVEQDRDGGAFAVMRCLPFDQISLVRSGPVARYSGKALEEFANRVLAMLPEMMAENPKVAARMTEPDHNV
jgi:hypothetical protein